MPPAPRDERISYGPRRAPEDRSMGAGRFYVPRPVPAKEKGRCLHASSNPRAATANTFVVTAIPLEFPENSRQDPSQRSDTITAGTWRANQSRALLLISGQSP